MPIESHYSEFQNTQGAFSKARSRAKGKKLLTTFFLFGLLLLFLGFAIQSFEVVAALSGLLWVIGLIAWALQFRHNKKSDNYLTKWLDGIRWAPEAIAAEEEFQLQAGDSRPYSATR